MSESIFKETLARTNRKILHLAESENWDELLTVSKERDNFIRSHFDDQSVKHDQKSTTTLLESIQESDRIVADKLNILKRKMIDDSLSLKHTQSAINSYRKTQGS